MKVVALKSYPTSREIAFILFDDNKTLIELDEQDPYRYHDCSPFARYLYTHKDEEYWKKVNEYPDAKEQI